MKTGQVIMAVLVLVLSVYSLGIFSRTIGFTILSNTSGQSPIGGNATIVNYCLVTISTAQAGTDYSESRDRIQFGSLFAVGAMGTPRRVVLSANQTGNRKINVSVNGTNWQCISGTCLGGETSTGQNCSMPVGVTRFLNMTRSPADEVTPASWSAGIYNTTSLDETAEYDTNGSILKSSASPTQIYPQINATSKWTNQTYWFNIKCPDNTSAGNYEQNITFSWECSTTE